MLELNNWKCKPRRSRGSGRIYRWCPPQHLLIVSLLHLKRYVRKDLYNINCSINCLKISRDWLTDNYFHGQHLFPWHTFHSNANAQILFTFFLLSDSSWSKLFMIRSPWVKNMLFYIFGVVIAVCDYDLKFVDVIWALLIWVIPEDPICPYMVANFKNPISVISIVISQNFKRSACTKDDGIIIITIIMIMT